MKLYSFAMGLLAFSIVVGALMMPFVLFAILAVAWRSK